MVSVTIAPVNVTDTNVLVDTSCAPSDGFVLNIKVLMGSFGKRTNLQSAPSSRWQVVSGCGAGVGVGGAAVGVGVGGTGGEVGSGVGVGGLGVAVGFTATAGFAHAAVWSADLLVVTRVTRPPVAPIR